MILMLAIVLSSILTAAQAIAGFGEPDVWTELGGLKGRPAMLAWSDRGTELYLETAEGETAATLKFHHYLLQRGAKPKPIDAQPAWAQAYWKWKSAKSFFGDPFMVIQVDTQQQVLDNLNGTAANKAAYLQQTLSGQDLLLAKQSGGTKITNRLVLKSHIIGEFVDEQIVPGYTFGWSPRDLNLIAFRALSGRLTVMNGEGDTMTVPGAKDVLLPAWSEDGSAIAYVERVDRKTPRLVVVPVL